MSESNPPGKRRFYQNVLDAYRLTKRTYPALPWMLLGTAAAVIAVFMLVAWLTNMSFIGWLVVGIMGSFTAALLLLSILTRSDNSASPAFVRVRHTGPVAPIWKIWPMS